MFYATRSTTEHYSLTAASAGAAKITNVGFEMNITAGTQGTISAKGRVDTVGKLMSLDMSGSGLNGLSLTAIFDLKAKIMYMDTAGLGATSLAPTKWVSIDMSANTAIAASFDNVNSNPLDAAKAFALAKKVVAVGMDKVGDETVKHYEVTVAAADAMAANPSLKNQLEQNGTTLPAEIVYQVYVNSDNQLRRMSFDTVVAGQKVATDITFTALGKVEPITVPDPKDVTDVTKSLGN